jgi:cytokinesis protein
MLYLAQLMASSNQLRSRCSVRAQLESSGLIAIFDKVRPWREPALEELIHGYEEEAEADRRELLEEQQQTLLHSMRVPEDVFRALLQTTRGTKASAYLLNVMRHLLLIRQDSDFVRFFQLIDRLIVSIVTSDTPEMNHDFSRAFGISVTHLIGKFVEQDRLEAATEEIKMLKAAVSKSTREKADMADEMAGGNDGLVGQLKAQVHELEEKLAKSRAATDAYRDQLEGTRRDYEVRIADLELIIQELFNMLREANHLDTVTGMDQGPINREKLIHDLREQWHRKKTIEKLEGGEGRKADDEEVGEVMEAAKVSIKRNTEVPNRKQALSGSQFLDAAEEDVRAHIEDALVRGSDHIVSHPQA